MSESSIDNDDSLSSRYSSSIGALSGESSFRAVRPRNDEVMEYQEEIPEKLPTIAETPAPKRYRRRRFRRRYTGVSIGKVMPQFHGLFNWKITPWLGVNLKMYNLKYGSKHSNYEMQRYQNAMQTAYHALMRNMYQEMRTYLESKAVMNRLQYDLLKKKKMALSVGYKLFGKNGVEKLKERFNNVLAMPRSLKRKGYRRKYIRRRYKK
jgi:hypothetical protein